MPYTYPYPRPAVTTDTIVFTQEPDRRILLIRRSREPYRNYWALPGGFVDENEPLHQAALRELAEETGLTGIALNQFHVFGAPGRDPRGHVISVVYIGFVNAPPPEVAGRDDAAEAGWFSINELPQLAFDHDKIIHLSLTNTASHRTGSF